MNKVLSFMVVLGTLVSVSAPVSAVAADLSTVKMTISANENYLRRFRKELESLGAPADPASTKKVESLSKKIKNLEMENERLTKVLEKNGGKAAAPVSAASVQPPAAPASIVPAAALKPIPAAPKAVPAAPDLEHRSVITGAAVSQWEKMTREKKEEYIDELVRELKKDGHFVQRHPLFYTALMDYVFVSDAALAAKPLKDAVTATIQKNEKAF